MPLQLAGPDAKGRDPNMGLVNGTYPDLYVRKSITWDNNGMTEGPLEQTVDAYWWQWLDLNPTVRAVKDCR